MLKGKNELKTYYSIIGNFIVFGWMDSFKNFLTFNRYGAYQRKSIVIGKKN